MKKAIALIILSIFTLLYVYTENIKRAAPRVVFCDVGQGDAIYLRLPEGKDVLVDAGPTAAVVSCLSEEMPYFDRTLELVFITHPQKDHYGGLSYLLSSFRIEKVFLPQSIEKASVSTAWQSFSRRLKKTTQEIVYLERTDQIQIGQSLIIVLSPFPDTKIETEEDLNNTALGLLAQVQAKQILLLSDLDAVPAERALEGVVADVDIFKLNHHGSKYGISGKLLELAEPEVVVLSVGRDNFYGHPHPETLQLLQSLNLPLRRTDKEGKIVIPL